MAKPEEITAFLKMFKKFKIVPLERWDYMATMSILGLKKSDVQDIISNLTFKDYSEGPQPDKGRHGQKVWTFGCQVEGKEIYIKLSDDFRYYRATCISFKIAEHPLHYPYREVKDTEKT